MTDKSFVLSNVRIIDGTGAEPFTGSVLVDGTKIAGVLRMPGELMKVSPDVDIIDCTGKTLTPGFVDAHVHITMDAEANIQNQLADSDPLLMMRGVRNATRTLRAGITTIRDLGSRNKLALDLRTAIERGLTDGPRMMVSGEPVIMTGGHGHFMGREADGPHEVRKAAREQLKAGADCIKLMSTGGVLTPGVNEGAAQLTEDELRAAIEEAHKAGFTSATHGIGNEGIKNALRAGIDSVEHGVHLDQEALDLLLSNDAYLVPTLSAVHHIVEKGTEAGIPEYAVTKAKRSYDAHLRSFGAALAAGVKLAMGTDASTPFNEHGRNLYELALMVQNGLSPLEAIRVSTSGGAQLLKWDDRIGTIEKGKLADLVLIDGDPLEDITLLQTAVVGVWKDGVRYV